MRNAKCLQFHQSYRPRVHLAHQAPLDAIVALLALLALPDAMAIAVFLIHRDPLVLQDHQGPRSKMLLQMVTNRSRIFTHQRQRLPLRRACVTTTPTAVSTTPTEVTIVVSTRATIASTALGLPRGISRVPDRMVEVAYVVAHPMMAE